MISIYLGDDPSVANSSIIKWGDYDAELLKNGPNAMDWFAPPNNDVSSWGLKGDRYGFGKADVSMLETSLLIAPEVPYIYMSDTTFN